jgi:hypothetical protein
MIHLVYLEMNLHGTGKFFHGVKRYLFLHDITQLLPPHHPDKVGKHPMAMPPQSVHV